MDMVLITGNTYPVKDALKALGGKWNAEKIGWEVPAEKEAEAKALVANAPTSEKKTTVTRRSYSKCQVCGVKASRYLRIYGSGECKDCYEERKMGY